MRFVVAVACMLASACLSFEPVGEDPGAPDSELPAGDGLGSDVDAGDAGDTGDIDLGPGDLDGDPSGDSGSGDEGPVDDSDPGGGDASAGDAEAGDATTGDPTGAGDSVGADATGPCEGVADGTVCSTGLCRAGACVAGQCFIGAEWFNDGQRNPASTCQQCSAATDPLVWSSATGSCDDGSPCTANDTCTSSTCTGVPYSCSPPGLPCQVAVCNGLGGCDYVVETDACLIDGQCLADGDPHPTQTCRECDPAQHQTRWSVSPDGTSCTDSGQCHSGFCCVGGCWDGNGCRTGYEATACGSGGGTCEDCARTHDCGDCPGVETCAGGLACAFPKTCDTGARICVRDIASDPLCCTNFCSPVDCY